MITVDGAYGEGGGQIIRTSLSLAAMTGTPVEIVNIRAGRAKPGLQPQHLTAVQAAAALCGAALTGAAIGAQRLVFTPRQSVAAGEYHFPIGTAGATALVLQTVLPPLVHATGPSRVTITGGTHVPFAPVAEYLAAVYLPALARAGLAVRLEVPRAGFYPQGGGELVAEITPGAVQPLHLAERGKLRALTAYLITARLPAHVALRGAAAVEQGLKSLGQRVTIITREVPAVSPGAAVVITAACENGHAGFSALGERGKPMEKVAEEACRACCAWWKSGAACDEHLADQLVLPLALASGESCWTTPTVTEHLRTVIAVVQQFLPRRLTLDTHAAGVPLVRCHPVP